jgi:hypothetical protein
MGSIFAEAISFYKNILVPNGSKSEPCLLWQF